MVRGSLRNISSSVATSLVTSARSYLSKAARTSATTSGISICNSLLPVQVMRLSPQGENYPIGSNEPFDRGVEAELTRQPWPNASHCPPGQSLVSTHPWGHPCLADRVIC